METALYLTPTSDRRANNVYDPAEDSFILLDSLEQDYLPKFSTYMESAMPNESSECPQPPITIVEIGSGSGVVINSLVKKLVQLFPLCPPIGIAIDINPDAVYATQQGAILNGISEHVEVIRGSLLEPVAERLAGRVDVLLFNPPYVPTQSCELSSDGIAASWAGGQEGTQVVNDLINSQAVEKVLSRSRPGLLGSFYMVLIAENNPEAIMARMSHLNPQSVLRRRAGCELLSVIRMSHS